MKGKTHEIPRGFSIHGKTMPGPDDGTTRRPWICTMHVSKCVGERLLIGPVYTGTGKGKAPHVAATRALAAALDEARRAMA